MTDYKGLFANKPPVAPKPAPVVVAEKPKTELKVWIEMNGITVNEGRLSMHLNGIDPKQRESVSKFGSVVTDLVRQQVDAVEQAVKELQPIASGFKSIKDDLNYLFERIMPPKKGMFAKMFGEKEEVMDPTEVKTRFSVIIAKTELYNKAATKLCGTFEHLTDTIPSITKQFAELPVAGQYLLTKVDDPDWVNKRLAALVMSENLQATSASQLKTGEETLRSYTDYLNDMKETLLPLWKTICTEIALRRCANETVDDKLKTSLNNAINKLKESV